MYEESVYIKLSCRDYTIGHLNYGDNFVPDDWKYEWQLTVQTCDVKAIITANSVSNAPKEIVISCLLAGLKKITDHWIYEGACSQAETQLGVFVDKWIQPNIAKVNHAEHTPAGSFYDIEVIPTVFRELVKEPVVTLINHSETSEIELKMAIDIGQEVVKSSAFVSHEVWEFDNAGCIDSVKSNLVQGLYKDMPELSHLWTQIRYNWFDIGSYFDTGNVVPFAYHYAGVNNVEDKRVNELPALLETVKHPLLGSASTLKYVIISLNDTYKWTRGQIADWLETLDVDISFKI